MTSERRTGSGNAPERPLGVCHVVFNLDFGGLENGLVNLVNRLPRAAYRHDILCLTTAGRFAERIRADNVRIHEIGKDPDSRDSGALVRVWRKLREIRPDIVHTRNLPTLDVPLIAKAARVPGLVHGEHGLDMLELAEGRRRYVWLRRLNRLVTDRYIALGLQLRDFLIEEVGVRAERIDVIYNGVDSDRFRPGDADQRGAARRSLLGGDDSPDRFIVGTVGRLAAIKNQIDLVRAARRVIDADPVVAGRLRVVILGDGPDRGMLDTAAAELGLSQIVILPGYRPDVAELMQAFDVFVLPSLREGVSNTILEAMACGLPVIATAVGANAELVEDGRSGLLARPEDPAALAKACLRLMRDDVLRRSLGEQARARAVDRFSMETMVSRYDEVYRRVAHLPSAGCEAHRPEN